MQDNTKNEKKLICVKKTSENQNLSVNKDSADFVEKIGDALVKNINGNSAAYSNTFNSILMAWKDISVKTREAEIEIQKKDAEHFRVMEKMDAVYQRRKNTIDTLLEETRRLQNQLETMDLNNLTEEEHKTYRSLLEQINNVTMALIKLYDGIM